MRISLRKWKKGTGSEGSYKENKKTYNKLCEEQKREETERFIKEAEEARTEDRGKGMGNRKQREEVAKQSKRRYKDGRVEKTLHRTSGRNGDERG